MTTSILLVRLKRYRRYVLYAFVLLLATIDSYAQNISFEVKGIEQDQVRTNVEKHLSHLQKSFKGESDNIALSRFLDIAPKTIHKALAPYGYFHPIIRHRVSKSQKGWQVIFKIKPGPPLIITDIDITIKGEGRDDQTFKKLIRNLPIKEGDRFNGEHYQSAKRQLTNLAMANGYLEHRYVTSQARLDRDNNKGQIILVLDTGPQYYFGETRFSDSKLSDGLLKRFVPYEQGDPYRSAKIKTLQEDLEKSGYFNQAWVIPDKKQARDNRIPVKVDLKPRPSQFYQLGVGAGSDTGPRVSATALFRRLNRWGHQLALSGRISFKHRSVQARYMIPGAHPAYERYSITGSINNEDLSNGRSDKRLIGVHSIQQFAGLQQTLGLTFQNEFSKPTNQPGFTTTLVVPSIDWVYAHKTHPTHSLEGYKLSLNMQGGEKDLFSDVTYFQTQLVGKWLKTLPLSNRLSLRGAIGHTAVKDVDKLPLSVRFYTGGARKIRGYDPQSIGPGTSMFEASAQAQHEVYDQIYVGPFYDAGNAAKDPFDDIQHSYGIAATWLSPVGAIELSFAHALTDRGDPFKFQFTMGPEL